MLPRVKIDFANGALGSVAPSSDCVIGLVCTATAVANKLALGNAYIMYQLSDLAAFGVTADESDANAFLYGQVRDFYAEAGDGAELWIMGVANTVKPSDSLDKNNDYAKTLLQVANGRIRCVVVAHKPAAGYEPTITDGLDADVMAAALKAQQLGEWAAETLFAPVFVVLAGRGYKKDNITALPELTEKNYNRVGILIGDTGVGSEAAAVALLAGRIGAIPVQRHIGRVKDGAVNALEIFIDDEDAAVANVETLNNKGFITFRTFVGKSGYFFSDDCLATAIADDYRSIARRRTIDKAYRIVYATMLENVNDEIPVTDAGKLVPAMVKSWETEIITAIVNQMTANGELGTDPNDANDKGVKCFIDYDQNVLATSKIEVVVQVKPYGYAKYIDVKLGFITTTTEE